ncbi:hypothetical protein JM16_006479 [Phytophthora kernoviae]|uniref:BTB domain-containing protein n=1 Tax=Phytophthora kernoviae TaxID=325452 RepID=A0A8T0LVJ9_9STRA|nr:hypothetical protein JM16_006479 [Phytophthora kernoviae]
MASRMENSAVQITTNAGQVSAVHSAPCAQQEQRHKLLDMCQRHELTDVVLLLQGDARESEVVGDEVVEVAAHRVVLATASPFFHALFTSGMKESRESCSHVPLPGVPVCAFRDLLRYIYVGELQLSGDTILSVLHTANRLELREVVEICCKQLMLQLSVANCVDIYMCCEQLQMRIACKLLAQAARAMIDTYFCEVYQSEAFKNLPLDAVLKILRHHKTQLPYRNTVDCATGDAAVKAWMMHDPLARRRQLSSALHTPQGGDNTGMVSEKAAQMILRRRNSGNAMVNSRELRSLSTDEDSADVSIANALAGDVVVDDVRQIQQQQLTPTIFVIGGFNTPGALNTVEYLDYHHMKHFIYAVGGFNGVAHLASVERFNLKTQQWEEMPLLSTGRSGLAVVALNGLVYAIGGVQIVSMADMSAVASVDATPTRPVGPTKVTLQFVAVGNAPLMKRTKFTVSGHDQLSVVYKFLRKQLRLKDTDSLVARSRRLQIKDSARCSSFQVGDVLVLNYSLTQAWG